LLFSLQGYVTQQPVEVNYCVVQKQRHFMTGIAPPKAIPPEKPIELPIELPVELPIELPVELPIISIDPAKRERGREMDRVPNFSILVCIPHTSASPATPACDNCRCEYLPPYVECRALPV
jgi:hypothetical protein